MRKLVIVIAAAAALSFGAGPAAASHSWGGYHWPYAGHTPFSVGLGDNTSGDWAPPTGYLSTVSGDWSASTVLDTPLATGHDPGGKPCKATPGQDEVCNARYGYNNWLGIAQIWIDTSTKHILKGTARVNDSWFSTSYYDDEDAKLHVLCQEVGHTLGLDHQHSTRTNPSRSCMDDETGLFDPAFAHPNQHDYDELVTIYTSHSDADTAASTTSPGRANSSAPVEVRSGRESLFVQGLGNGRKLFTWVLWKDPDAPHSFPQ